MPSKAVVSLILLFFGFHSLSGQTIKGEVLDMSDKHAVADVSIENIYTSVKITTNADGGFFIAALGGELLEFKKNGYKTVRVRIPKGYMPNYFRIIMTKGISDLKEINVAKTTRYDYTADSIRFHEIYKHELEFPKMSTFDMIAHPFSAMSSRNREIWQFQDDYDATEKEKYVDKTFNESLVTRFTGLTGDSLHYYMKRYRPTYEQLTNMNDYTFFNYIKSSVHQYRTRNTPRGAQ